MAAMTIARRKPEIMDRKSMDMLTASNITENRLAKSLFMCWVDISAKLS